MQRTRVIVVSPEQRAALRRSVDAGDFEHRAVPHAEFSVKGDGVVATLYSSGKLVIQGADPDLFAARYLGLEPAGAPEPAAAVLSGPLVGSDETGKGDYFGPLIVAAVRVEPAQARDLARSRVVDSKLLADETALRLGAALRSRYPHAIERLDPPRYNEVYAACDGGLNGVLADLHAQAIHRLARPGDHVVVDQFARASLLEERLADLDVTLEQRPRGEEIPVVAAASVIAREAFLLALRELSERVGVDLHKGAGDPVDRAGERFVRLHGDVGLADVAKLHFKNTQKIRARTRRG
jgi:ribonuclease HIII